ncbi:MAG: hypothetical protein AAB488_01130 [Patescibacteria group bacterium]
MSKRKTILWLGLLVAILPFLGFPSAWKPVIYFISGLLIAVNSYQLSKHKMMRSRRAERKHRENIAMPVGENSSVVSENTKMFQAPDIVSPANSITQDSTNNPSIGV